MNGDLIDQFVKAQGFTKTCSSEPQSFNKHRELVDEIVRNLAIPLLQHLFFHTSDEYYEYVVFSRFSFVPSVRRVQGGHIRQRRTCSDTGKGSQGKALFARRLGRHFPGSHAFDRARSTQLRRNDHDLRYHFSGRLTNVHGRQ